MNQTLHDKIEAYLAGEMPPEERRSFEQTMDADPSVAEELALYQLEREGHELLIEQELREKTLAWMGDPISPEGSTAEEAAAARRFNSPVLWVLGLVLALLLAVGLYRLLLRDLPAESSPTEESAPTPPAPANNAPAPTEPVAKQQEPTPYTKEKSVPADERNPNQLLAMAHYEKPDFSGEIRGSNKNGSSFTPLSDAVAAWDKGDLHSVISLLQKMPANDPFYLQGQEMLGHAYFLNKNYAQAAATFANIRKNDNSEMAERAAWHEALSWLADGKADRAKPLLEEIQADAGHPYQEEANRLLTNIR